MFVRFLLLICLSAAAWSQTRTTADNKPPASKESVTTTGNSTDALASANALIRTHKFPEASAAFRAILEKDSTSVEAHVGLIRSLLLTGKAYEAADAGQKAIAAVPSSASVHAVLGDVYYRLAQMSDAEHEYGAAVALDSNSPRGLYGMARLYTMLFMFKSAKRNLAKAHELAPQDEAITRAWIYSLPRKERLAAFKQALAKSGEEKGPSAVEDDEPSLRDEETLKIFAAEAEKKVWALAKPPEKTEITLEPYGRTLGEININKGGQEGAMAISRGFGVQVKFNDRAGSMLLLDTGASGIIIGSKLAEKAGAVKIAETRYRGIGEGSTKGYVAWIDKIKIGNVEFHDCLVEVSSKKEIADDSGLIGTDVFDEFLITLDFEERKMKLAPLPKNPDATGAEDEALDRYVAPEMQSFAKVFHFGHLLAVPAVLGTPKRNATGLFVLDTGAFANTISLDLARRLTKVSFEEGYIQGVSAKIKEIFSGDQIYLHFAGIHVSSGDITAFDHSSVSTGVEISGFIGIRTLVQSRMTIDYRDGLVKIEPYVKRSL